MYLWTKKGNVLIFPHIQYMPPDNVKISLDLCLDICSLLGLFHTFGTISPFLAEQLGLLF